MQSLDNNQQIEIADQLLKQLEDEYWSVQDQNLPKENLLPQDDAQNPYQSLQFEGDDSDSHSQSQENNVQQQVLNTQQQQMKHLQNFQQFHQNISNQAQSNPQVRYQLIQVPPTDESIYTNLPVRQFNIDQQKVKALSLSFDIPEPDWFKNEQQCKKRIEKLFGMQKPKGFTKI